MTEGVSVALVVPDAVWVCVVDWLWVADCDLVPDAEGV